MKEKSLKHQFQAMSLTWADGVFTVKLLEFSLIQKPTLMVS